MENLRKIKELTGLTFERIQRYIKKHDAFTSSIGETCSFKVKKDEQIKGMGFLYGEELKEYGDISELYDESVFIVIREKKEGTNDLSFSYYGSESLDKSLVTHYDRDNMKKLIGEILKKDKKVL